MFPLDVLPSEVIYLTNPGVHLVFVLAVIAQFWQSSFASRRYLLRFAILHSILAEADAVGAAPAEPVAEAHAAVRPAAASEVALVVVAFVAAVVLAVVVVVVVGELELELRLVVEFAAGVAVAVIDFGIGLVAEQSCSASAADAA